MAIGTIIARGPIGPDRSVDALVELLTGDPKKAADLITEMRALSTESAQALEEIANRERAHAEQVRLDTESIATQQADLDSRKASFQLAEEAQRRRSDRQDERDTEFEAKKQDTLDEYGRNAGQLLERGQAVAARETAVSAREKRCDTRDAEIAQAQIDLDQEREQFEADRAALIKQREEAAEFLARTAV